MKPIHLPLKDIESKIHIIRDRKVMFDVDLAMLYGVTTFNLNKSVRRNFSRFPEDFMFQLTEAEAEPLKFQIGMSKVRGRGGRRTLPYAFTQEGIAMLSSALRSEQAIEVNIAIMRVFVHLREMLVTHGDLSRRLDVLEGKYEKRFKIVFDAIRKLMSEQSVPRKRVKALDLGSE